jgi:hypothetical protein
MFSPLMDYVQHGKDENGGVPCSITDSSAQCWRDKADTFRQNQAASINSDEMSVDYVPSDRCQCESALFFLKDNYLRLENHCEEMEKRLVKTREGFIQQQALGREKIAELEKLLKSQKDVYTLLELRLHWLENRLAVAGSETRQEKTFLSVAASPYSLQPLPTRKRKHSNSHHDTDRRTYKRCRYF